MSRNRTRKQIQATQLGDIIGVGPFGVLLHYVHKWVPGEGMKPLCDDMLGLVSAFPPGDSSHNISFCGTCVVEFVARGGVHRA